MDKVLQDIRVLDFSRYGSGPYCGALLADMGAEVIKVESPGGGIDRQFGPFAPNGENIVYGMILARNKKGITLDLRRSIHPSFWCLSPVVGLSALMPRNSLLII